MDLKIAFLDHLPITGHKVFRLNTFGRLFLERDGHRVSGAAAQPRRLALLALVAAAGDQGMTRDQLLAMLWPESDEERARKGLNQALYALRQELGDDEIFLGTREVRLNPDLVASDLAAFWAAIRSGHLERATAEYTGPFLAGFHLSDAAEFERWLEEERASLARDYATALQQLARRTGEQGNWTESVEWWRRLAAQDPLNARVAIGLMEALVATGDRAGALQHARVYEALLQQELEAPPDRAVVALAERIRRQSASLPTLVQSDPEPQPAASGAEAPQPVEAPRPPASAPTRKVSSPVSRRAAAIASLALGLAAGAALLRPSPHREIRLGHTSRVTAEPGLELYPALSPDGRLVAYAAGPAGQLRIYVRQLAGGRTIPVTQGLAGDQHWPRWSPDGTLLSFEMGRAIYVVPALGGAAKLLVSDDPPSEDGPGFLAWSPDGRRIAYAVDRAIFVRATGGGRATRVAILDQPHSFAWSPDGTRLAFARGNAAFVYSTNAIGNIGSSSIWTIPVTGGEPTRITDAASLNTSPAWTSNGRGLLFVSNRDGSRDVYRIALNRSGGPAGAPVRLTAGLQPHTISLSRDGRVLAYATFTDYANIWSLPVAERSPVSLAEAQPLTTGHQSIEGLAISRDGRWLAFDSDRGGDQAIYRMPLSGGEPEQLSADSGDDFMPSWSPDAREIAYYGFREGRRRLFVLPVGGGSAGPVVADSGNQRFPDWAPDGRHLVFHSDRTGRFELYLVGRDTAGRWEAARQLTTEGGQDARWSPDGRAIVYLRNDGLWTISPDGGRPRLLVAGDSSSPRPLLAQWSPDGRTLYYKALDAEGRASFWSIPAEGGVPRLLARFDDARRPSSRAEFATDGRRLYFTISERESDIWQTALGDR